MFISARRIILKYIMSIEIKLRMAFAAFREAHRFLVPYARARRGPELIESGQNLALNRPMDCAVPA
jgi:hypothetical protein